MCALFINSPRVIFFHSKIIFMSFNGTMMFSVLVNAGENNQNSVVVENKRNIENKTKIASTQKILSMHQINRLFIGWKPSLNTRFITIHRISQCPIIVCLVRGIEWHAQFWMVCVHQTLCDMALVLWLEYSLKWSFFFERGATVTYTENSIDLADFFSDFRDSNWRIKGFECVCLGWKGQFGCM